MGKSADMKLKFTVIKNEDTELFLDTDDKEKFEELVKEINIGRELNGKSSSNTYLVINTDEPYADEVVEVLKRHGHWG
ncbi:hypothetical protein HF072_12850 [Bacillus sp. RO3]|nr:hypothetical protein [Bacillus sp. RO3]